jgi:MFS family permease
MVEEGATGSLWRHRDFMLLWSGQTVSLFGSQVSWLALPLVAVAVLKASTFQVAALGAMNALPPLLVSLPVGVLVDRIGKRWLMIGCDVGSALAMASIPLAGVLGHVTLAQLYAVSLVVGTLGTVFAPASSTVLPALLGRERLIGANAKVNTSRALAEMAGPSAGGFLIGVLGAARAVGVDAVSYACSALALAAMRFREPGRPAAAGGRRFRAELAEGLRLVLGDPVLRALSLSGAFGSFLLRGVSSVWLLYVVRDLHWSVHAAGLVYGLSLIGGVAGSLVAESVVARIGMGTAMILGTLLSAPFEMITPSVPPGAAGQWVVAAVFAALTAAGMVYGTAAGTTCQLICPPRLLGRMNSSRRFLQACTTPLGPLAAGGLGTCIGLRPTLFLLAGATLLWPLMLLASPVRALREVPVRHEPAPAAA